MKLEIGAGSRPTEGYIHLDIRAGKDIEIVADARKIPVQDEDCEEVYSHWVLEHFGQHEMVDVLKEWMRVLKVGGKIRIVTSNQHAINKAWNNGEITWSEWNRLTFGLPEPDEKDYWKMRNEILFEDCHKIGFSESSIRQFMELAGMKNVFVEATTKVRDELGKMKCPALIAEGWKL